MSAAAGRRDKDMTTVNWNVAEILGGAMKNHNKAGERSKSTGLNKAWGEAAASALLTARAAFCLALAFSVTPVFGASNAGTSGAQFLKIDAGARPAAMGGAYTAIADDINALAWNPAGLSRLQRPEFTAMHSQWFQGSNYAFMAAAVPTKAGTIGLGMTSFSVDEIEKRAGDTAAADGTFDSNDAAYTVSYGKGMGENLALGVSLMYVNQKLDTESAGAMAGDLGLLWNTPHKPLTVGVAVKHLGGEIKFVDESDPLPMTVALGFGYRLMEDKVKLAMDVSKPNDTDAQVGVGAELGQALYKDLKGSLRAGYTTAGSDVTEGLTGVSMGGGLSWRHFGFDMAWVPYGVLGNTFRYAFLVKF